MCVCVCVRARARVSENTYVSSVPNGAEFDLCRTYWDKFLRKACSVCAQRRNAEDKQLSRFLKVIF